MAIISILNNVMNLAGVSSFTQIVIKGVIVLIAVLLAAGVTRRVAEGVGGVRQRPGRGTVCKETWQRDRSQAKRRLATGPRGGWQQSGVISPWSGRGQSS